MSRISSSPISSLPVADKKEKKATPKATLADLRDSAKFLTISIPLADLTQTPTDDGTVFLNNAEDSYKAMRGYLSDGTMVYVKRVVIPGPKGPQKKAEPQPAPVEQPAPGPNMEQVFRLFNDMMGRINELEAAAAAPKKAAKK